MGTVSFRRSIIHIYNYDIYKLLGYLYSIIYKYKLLHFAMLKQILDVWSLFCLNNFFFYFITCSKIKGVHITWILDLRYFLRKILAVIFIYCINTKVHHLHVHVCRHLLTIVHIITLRTIVNIMCRSKRGLTKIFLIW